MTLGSLSVEPWVLGAGGGGAGGPSVTGRVSLSGYGVLGEVASGPEI